MRYATRSRHSCCGYFKFFSSYFRPTVKYFTPTAFTIRKHGAKDHEGVKNRKETPTKENETTLQHWAKDTIIVHAFNSHEMALLSVHVHAQCVFLTHLKNIRINSPSAEPIKRLGGHTKWINNFTDSHLPTKINAGLHACVRACVCRTHSPCCTRCILHNEKCTWMVSHWIRSLCICMAVVHVELFARLHNANEKSQSSKYKIDRFSKQH